MTEREFVYWLQGFSELNTDGKAPSKKQWQIIKDHLQLVFNKQTPNRMKEGDVIPVVNPITPGIGTPLVTPPVPWDNLPTITCDSTDPNTSLFCSQFSNLGAGIPDTAEKAAKEGKIC